MTPEGHLCASCNSPAETVRTDPRLRELVAQKETLILSPRRVRVPLCGECADHLDDCLAADDGRGVLNDRRMQGADLDNFVLGLAPRPILDASGHDSPSAD